MSNVTLKQAKAQFISSLESVLDAMISDVETFDYSKEGNQLTNGVLAECYAEPSGLDKVLIQLAMSDITRSSDTHHIVRGRNGGFKLGPSPEPKGPKPPSKNALIRAENAELKARLAALEAAQVASVVVSEVEASPETELMSELDFGPNSLRG